MIATLRSEEAVLKYIEEKRPQDTLKGLGIIHTNRSSSTGGTYRIFASVDSDKEEAEIQMRLLHDSHNEYADAWVYQYPLK